MAEITREELLARYKAGERDFSRLDFSGLDLSGIKDEELLPTDFFYSTNRQLCYPLEGCIFRGANFCYVNFSRTTVIYSDFQDAILFRVNFTDSSLSGAIFTGADMREVTFDGGEGIGVVFENANLQGATGSFGNQKALGLHIHIGWDGTFIELFNEETVRRECSREYVEERCGMILEEFERIHRPVKRINPDAEIPF
jgi:uncharacterized protein YjbI with pentapeptide repeats